MNRPLRLAPIGAVASIRTRNAAEDHKQALDLARRYPEAILAAAWRHRMEADAQGHDKLNRGHLKP